MEKSVPGLLFCLLFSIHMSFGQTGPLDTVVFQQVLDLPFAGIGLPQKVVEDQLGRPFFYVASKEGGLRIYNISSPNAPELIQEITVSELQGQEVMNLCQSGSFLYLALGNFFGGSNPPGMAVVDISDPENAVVRDVWVSEMTGRGCAFVTVSDNYAYLGAMSRGLVILNIENKDDIFQVSELVPDIHFPVENPTSVQLPNARGMSVRGDTVWLCYDAGGLRLIDVSDKQHPIETGRYINQAALGKQQAYNNIILENGKAYIAIDYCGLEVLDISNPAQIQQKAWWNPWDCQSPNNAWINSPGHSNQIEMDPARHLLFLSTGRSELNVVDVSDPEHPFQAGSFGNPDDLYFTWGLGLSGDRVYLTYIASVFPFFSIWSGVRILEWDALTSTKQVNALSSIRVFPQPFQDGFRIECTDNNVKILGFQIVDLQGNVLLDNKPADTLVSQHSRYIPFQAPAGIYFLKCSTSSGYFTQKLIHLTR